MATDADIQKVIIREYESDEPVISEGEKNDRFYVVLQGKVDVRISDKRLRTLTDGDVFGIEYHYLDQPFNITAVSLTKSRIASYHTSMIREIIYDHPRLTQQIMTSLAKQVEQTTLFLSKILVSSTTVELVKTPLPEVKTLKTDIETNHLDFQDDILDSFIKEAKLLLDELYDLGDSLKRVDIPNEAETKKLIDFSQRLNRLIGGTASIGFEKFAILSRKTSLLASKCGEMKGLTIRDIISNLNLVISVLKECFHSLETIKDSESKIPALEMKIDICMTSAGIENPELKTQEEIDEMFEERKRENS